MTTSKQTETLFWRKKEFLSFILSILVFLIHISSFGQYTNTGSLISAVNEKLCFFFSESITRFAVPMFFILSGIAFFRDYDNKKYAKKIKSRIRTLVIPYLLWNTIWMFFDIFCSTYLSKYFIGRQLFTITLPNVFQAIFFYKCNGPFWFVFNLIVFSLAAPLIHVVIRNKYIGISSVVLLTVLAVFEIGLPATLFFSPTSIIFFLIGAIIGKHYFSWISGKTSSGMQVCSIIFLAAYIILKTFFGAEKSLLTPLLEVVIFTAASFALWSITDIFLGKIQPKRIYSRSFAIFAMHINVSAIIAKLFFLCFPKTEWMAIPNFVVTVMITLLLINLLCTILERYFPAVYSLLIGSR